MPDGTASWSRRVIGMLTATTSTVSATWAVITAIVLWIRVSTRQQVIMVAPTAATGADRENPRRPPSTPPRPSADMSPAQCGP
jgi:hypothetical protein